ncbi:MAG: DNA polymerase III subunit gamma/tau [Candidatus Shapirobacteria bacterium]|jgi:DNA polymerase-3 subunit gamma/tau
MAVYYLQYRPQTISELDNSSGREVLGSIFKKKVVEGSIPKSYLFCGPKGSGKTSAARIFAKAVNCLKEGTDACGKCENCLEIGRGKSMDIMEMDAASNRGIDEVRMLKEKVFLAPTKLKNKVIIIDEAQMMTKEAFGALLKLLEEPPANTYFIMCTTDPQKIPETIVSRLVKVEFNAGKEEDLKMSLDRVVKSEELEMSQTVAAGLIAKSEGSFRNLHRLLNELVIEVGKKIGDEEWTKFSSRIWGTYGAGELLSDLETKEVEEILAKIEEMAQKGVDFSAFLERLVLTSQQQLLAGGGDNEKRNYWVRWIDQLIGASGQMKYCPLSQLPLELAVVKFKEKPGSVPTTTKEIIPQPKKEVVSQKDEKIVKKVAVGSVSLEQIAEKWAEVLAKVKPYNHSIEAFLRATKPVELEGNELTVEVFYPFHKERLEETRNRRVIEEVLKLVLGSELVFVCKLGKPGVKPPIVVPKVESVEAGSKPATEPENKDLYQAAREIFG